MKDKRTEIIARVRFCPSDTDETFDGTVIDEKEHFYVVIPDSDLMLTQKWNKKRCEVISKKTNQ